MLIVAVSEKGEVDVRHEKFGELCKETVRHCHTLHHWKMLMRYDSLFLERDTPDILA